MPTPRNWETNRSLDSCLAAAVTSCMFDMDEDRLIDKDPVTVRYIETNPRVDKETSLSQGFQLRQQSSWSMSIEWIH